MESHSKLQGPLFTFNMVVFDAKGSPVSHLRPVDCPHPQAE